VLLARWIERTALIAAAVFVTVFGAGISLLASGAVLSLVVHGVERNEGFFRRAETGA